VIAEIDGAEILAAMTRRNTGFRSAPVLPMGAAIVLVVVAGCASHGDLAANAGTPSGKGLAANDMRPTAGGVARVTVGDLTRTPSEDVLCSPTAVPASGVIILVGTAEEHLWSSTWS
jgi:hypothetical protein